MAEKKYLYDKSIEIGEYIIEHNCTVRHAAMYFNMSKSNVHISIVKRLPNVCPELFRKVVLVMDKNKAERHIRGGIATQRKWRRLKEG